MPKYRVESFPDDEDTTLIRTFTADGFLIDEENLLFVNGDGDSDTPLKVVAACSSGWRFVEKVSDTPTSAEVDAELERVADQLGIPPMPVLPIFKAPEADQ